MSDDIENMVKELRLIQEALKVAKDQAVQGIDAIEVVGKKAFNAGLFTGTGVALLFFAVLYWLGYISLHLP